MGQSTSKVTYKKDKYTYNEATDWPYVWALRDGSVLDWRVGLSDDEILARQTQQADLPTAITPTLYLGNCQSAHDLEKLQRLGIRRVLNMAGPSATPLAIVEAYAKHGITYNVMNAQDEEDYPLLDMHWEEAHAFINAGLEHKLKVLVHCVAGHNRSSLIVASQHLLMSSSNTVLDTIRHIRLQRGNVALHNEGFQEQLVAFARVHDRAGAPPTSACPPPSSSKRPSRREHPLHKLSTFEFT